MEVVDDESESMGEVSEAEVKCRQENGEIEQSLSVFPAKNFWRWRGA